MKKSLETLVNIPNTLKGNCYFNGTPNPSDALIRVIGQQGIDQVQQKLNQLVSTEQETQTTDKTENQGMYHLQLFFELQKRILISVHQVIDNQTLFDRQPYQLAILQLPAIEFLKDTEKYPDWFCKFIVLKGLQFGPHNKHLIEQLPRKNKLL